MEINSITTFPNRVLATSCDFQIIDEKANLSGAIHPSIIHPCTYHVPGSVVGSGKWQSWDGKGLLPEPTGLAVLSAAPPPGASCTPSGEADVGTHGAWSGSESESTNAKLSLPPKTDRNKAQGFILISL